VKKANGENENEGKRIERRNEAGGVLSEAEVAVLK